MDPLPLDQHVDPDAIATALAPWLDDLEARIDPDDEERLWRDWKRFADGTWEEPEFRPRRRAPAPSRLAWQRHGIVTALTDPQRMVMDQLCNVHDTLAAGGGALLCVRANYGTGILPSVFGVPVVQMPPHMWSLPGTLPLGREAMDGLVARGVPSLDGGLWPVVRGVGQALVRCVAGRPRLTRHLHIYHPDLQGPMDALEMAWGSACFTSMIEEPELVHAVMRVMTDAYRALIADWDAVVPVAEPGYCAHWSMLHRGHIMLRDDSAMNLSRRMFDQFIAPYDAELLAACGGGAIHACGKVDHYLDHATSLPGVHAFNFGQPGHNDPARIVGGTIAKGVAIIGISAEDWSAVGAAGRGLVHVWP